MCSSDLGDITTETSTGYPPSAAQPRLAAPCASTAGHARGHNLDGMLRALLSRREPRLSPFPRRADQNQLHAGQWRIYVQAVGSTDLSCAHRHMGREMDRASSLDAHQGRAIAKQLSRWLARLHKRETTHDTGMEEQKPEPALFPSLCCILPLPPWL